MNIDLDKIKEIINKHDPVGLLSLGAPDNEYLPEIQSIHSLITKEKNLAIYEIEKLIKNVFEGFFNEETINQNVSSYKAIANELKESIKNK